MAFKMLLLSFSVLLIVKVTFGRIINCDRDPFENCKAGEVYSVIPREVSEFYDRCAETKSYFRCINDYQVRCGMLRMMIFPRPDQYQDFYDTLSDICEEGNLLNSILTDNLKCFNETFGKTTCHEDAEAFVEPLYKRAREDEESQHKLNIFCLEQTFVDECALRALSENCGELVAETTLEIFRRSKSIEYSCSESGAQSVLDELDNLDLSEDQKKGITLILEKLVDYKTAVPQ